MRLPYYRTNQLLATDIDDIRCGEGQSAEITAFGGLISRLAFPFRRQVIQPEVPGRLPGLVTVRLYQSACGQKLNASQSTEGVVATKPLPLLIPALSRNPVGAASAARGKIGIRDFKTGMSIRALRVMKEARSGITVFAPIVTLRPVRRPAKTSRICIQM